MRVFAATLGTETNTFSPIPTGEGAFRTRAYFPAGKHPDKKLLFSGPLLVARERARQNGWTLHEGMVAFAEPAGPTTRAAYESLRAELLADLERAGPVDMIVLGMHGAMVADGYDDCEGDLLARVRAMAPDAVIGAELDPHCHLSDAMLRHADVLVCFKEYPHTDFMERAGELVALCAAAVQGKVKPVMAAFDCRMIGIYHTPREPMRSFVDRMKALEGRDGILSVSIAQGFPWGDVADMGTKVLVVADGDEGKAATLAERLGRELIALRGTTGPTYLTIDEALDRATAAPQGPIVIAEAADNPGGGAPSDATFVLERLLARGMGDVAFGPFYDPLSVAFCHDAGLGARLRLRIGGKLGPTSGAPLDLEVEVIGLARDLEQAFGEGRARLGDAAAVRVIDPRAPNIDLALVSIRNQATGRELFTGLGVAPERKRIVVVKSSQHFHAAFAPIARDVLYVGGPGAIAVDLATFDYRHVRRPMWPFDPHPLA